MVSTKTVLWGRRHRIEKHDASDPLNPAIFQRRQTPVYPAPGRLFQNRNGKSAAIVDSLSLL